jgi:nicotinamidase-related amidase
MGFPYHPGTSVEVPEIPYSEEMKLPPESTALVVVDMQNDFVREDGALRVEAAAETLPRIRALLEKARVSGVRVAFTQDSQVAEDPEFSVWPEHCRIGSWGWQIVDELTPAQHELVCRKNRYDAFYDSWLDHFLTRIWKVEHVVIVGTVSNICVLHTAASAGLRWFHVMTAADCISALTEFDQALTLRQISSLYAGHVLRSGEDIRFGA